VSRLPVPALHLVTSRRRLSPDARTVLDELRALEALLDAALESGVDVVQIRERDLDAGALFALVSRVVGRAASLDTRVLVNERADVARAAGAAGVHLPSSGMSADRIRTVEPAWTIGRSIHEGDDPPDRGACDYLLFGTVFVSESKMEGSPVAGVDGLARAVRLTGRPVVAIGGVTPDRVRSCLDAGAVGVAAIGSFLPPGRARDAMGVRAAVAAYRAALSGGRRAPSL
jgi:thiamine-phosphate diphosphorylase